MLSCFLSRHITCLNRMCWTQVRRDKLDTLDTFNVIPSIAQRDQEHVPSSIPSRPEN